MIREIIESQYFTEIEYTNKTRKALITKSWEASIRYDLNVLIEYFSGLYSEYISLVSNLKLNDWKDKLEGIKSFIDGLENKKSESNYLIEKIKIEPLKEQKQNFLQFNIPFWKEMRKYLIPYSSNIFINFNQIKKQFIFKLKFNRELFSKDPFYEQKDLIKNKGRKGQVCFRKNILKSFDNKCVLTNINFIPVLEAAHIKPYSHFDDKMEANSNNNGLCLSRNMHKLFDDGYIKFDDFGNLLKSKEFFWWSTI